ncbi:epoxide hydrolase family protein [Frigidibacter albus]|nr:epoxide hydrolase family protein [Frigidibacter albus]
MQPYQIPFDPDALAELHQRLDRARRVRPVDGAGWDYGIEAGYLDALLADWRAFDWQVQVERLNRLPHQMIEVQGHPIHFVHFPGQGLPVVLSHGWPSTFLEMLPLAERLSAAGHAVILPSLPGIGYSPAATVPGMSAQRVALLWHGLMQALGHDRYAAHGCDVGAHITALMAAEPQGRLIGAHIGSVPLPGARQETRSPEDAAYLARVKAWRDRETGYVEIQRTKPDTLAAALIDSPAGQAAWMAEKFRAWSDPATPIPRETVLATLSIYWFTGCIAPSMRYYLETARLPRRLDAPITLPCGFFLEAPDAGADPATGKLGRAGAPPRAATEPAWNIRRWFVAPEGGHFPALETPDLLAGELLAFLASLEK